MARRVGLALCVLSLPLFVLGAGLSDWLCRLLALAAASLFLTSGMLRLWLCRRRRRWLASDPPY